jgi:hypothetical protein
MATYITHVSAGPWHMVRSEHDGIPLGIFCRQSLARYLDPDELFEVTRQGFDFYHQAFAIKYPFGKYDQLRVRRPDQRALVEPYRPEYFAAVGEVWREWSSAIAQDFVEGGYSVCAIDQATIEATDAYLASSPEPPTALRRLLNEAKDEVLRALRNQSRDREAASLEQ